MVGHLVANEEVAVRFRLPARFASKMAVSVRSFLFLVSVDKTTCKKILDKLVFM